MSATATPAVFPPVRSGFPSGRPRRDKFAAKARGSAAAVEHEILFQKFFKSVGPRTYAAQVKRAKNGKP